MTVHLCLQMCLQMATGRMLLIREGLRRNIKSGRLAFITSDPAITLPTTPERGSVQRAVGSRVGKDVVVRPG